MTTYNDPSVIGTAPKDYLDVDAADLRYLQLDDAVTDYAAIDHAHTGTYAPVTHDHTAGSIFGGSGNTLTISNAGAVTFAGTAKITHHEQIPLAAVSFVGTTDGAYATVVGGKLVNQNTDIAYVTCEVYESWDGANVFFEVDWLPTTALTENETVIWKFEYKAIAEGEDADTGSTKTVTVTHTAPVGGTAAGIVVHSRATIVYNDATQPLAAGDHIFFKILRDATADTFAGDTLVTAFEYIWTANGLSTA
jgi:hypothetical protein